MGLEQFYKVAICICQQIKKRPFWHKTMMAQLSSFHFWFFFFIFLHFPCIHLAGSQHKSALIMRKTQTLHLAMAGWLIRFNSWQEALPHISCLCFKASQRRRQRRQRRNSMKFQQQWNGCLLTQ